MIALGILIWCGSQVAMVVGIAICVILVIVLIITVIMQEKAAQEEAKANATA